MASVYLIKDLAQLTGFSVDSIKFYCKKGLLKESGRSPGTNFRYFGDESVAVLRRIRALRTQGQSLKKIAEILKQEPKEIPATREDHQQESPS